MVDYQGSKSCSDQIWHWGLNSLDTQEGNRETSHIAVRSVCNLAFGFTSELLDSLIIFFFLVSTRVSDSNVEFPGLWTFRERFSGHVSHSMRTFFGKLTKENCHAWTKKQSFVKLL